MLDGSGAPFEIAIDIPFEDFIELYVNNALWTLGEDYAATSGSTIITIQAERLDLLSAGYQTIDAVFLDETVNITFDLIEPIAQGALDIISSDSGNSLPRTGNTVILSYISFLISGVASALIYAKRDKSKNGVRRRGKIWIM